MCLPPFEAHELASARQASLPLEHRTIRGRRVAQGTSGSGAHPYQQSVRSVSSTTGTSRQDSERTQSPPDPKARTKSKDRSIQLMFHVKHSPSSFHVKQFLAADLRRSYISAPTIPRLKDKAVPKVVAIANQKGGVGKTTTAVNLAASLAVAEQRTLLIDGDPQGNASSGVGLARESVSKTVYDVLIGNSSLDDVIHSGVQFRHLDVAPATADLAAAEVELVDQPERDRAMRNALTAVKDRYDYVLIDCPPSLGLITVNMLAAADTLLIPVQCEYYALEGLSQLLNTVHLVQRSVNERLEIEGVLLTMYDARLNLSRQVAADAREYFGSQVYDTVIPRNIRLAEAPSFGKPIIVYDVASVGAQSYMSVARELIARNGSNIPTPEPDSSLPPLNVSETQDELANQPNAWQTSD